MKMPDLSLGNVRWRLANGRVHVSNAWYRAAGRRIRGARTQFSNRRNLKAIQRGRRDIPARVGDQVRSRTPVVRARINRSTGRPHGDDVRTGRAIDRTLALRQQRDLRAAAARNRASRAGRSR